MTDFYLYQLGQYLIDPWFLISTPVIFWASLRFVRYLDSKENPRELPSQATDFQRFLSASHLSDVKKRARDIKKTEKIFKLLEKETSR